MGNYDCLKKMAAGFGLISTGLQMIDEAVDDTHNPYLTQEGENIVFVFAQFKKELENLYVNYAATVEDTIQQSGIQTNFSIIKKERSLGKGGG